MPPSSGHPWYDLRDRSRGWRYRWKWGGSERGRWTGRWGGDTTIAVDGGAIIAVWPGAGPGGSGLTATNGPSYAGGPVRQQQGSVGGNVSNIGNGPGFGGSSCGLSQTTFCTFCNARACPGFAAAVCIGATCTGGAAGTNGTTITNAGGSGGGGGGAGGGGNGAAGGNGGNGNGAGSGGNGTTPSNAGANTGAGGGGGERAATEAPVAAPARQAATAARARSGFSMRARHPMALFAKLVSRGLSYWAAPEIWKTMERK